MSFSAFFSLNQSAEKTMKSLIYYYLPEGGMIYDPTCGEKNYQFRWLKDKNYPALDSWLPKAKIKVTKKEPEFKYKYMASDMKRVGNFVADVHHLPVKNKFAKITVYDPPFTPSANEDQRAEDYGIAVPRTVDDVKAFFSVDIMKELARVTEKYVFVRGEDFYFPASSTNYYPFYKVALSNIEAAGLKELAVYPYRFNRKRLPLIRARLRHVIRPIITHAYVAVLRIV